METPTKARNVMLSALDCARLKDLLVTANQFGGTHPALLDTLEAELEKAIIVLPEEIPPYVVTMNTCFRLTDTKTGENVQYSLVFPSEEDIEHGKLSILTPLGVSVLGYCIGNTVQMECPEGEKCMRIDMIYFQPEAVKHYHI